MNYYDSNSNKNDDMHALPPPPPPEMTNGESDRPSFSRMDMTGLISHSEVPTESMAEHHVDDSERTEDDNYDDEEESRDFGTGGGTPLVTKRKNSGVKPPPKPKVDTKSIARTQKSEIEWTYGSTASLSGESNNKSKTKKKKKKNSSTNKKKPTIGGGFDEGSTESSTDEDDSDHYRNTGDIEVGSATTKKMSNNHSAANSGVTIKYNRDERQREPQDDTRREDTESEDSDFFEIECGQSAKVSMLQFNLRGSILMNTRESAYKTIPLSDDYKGPEKRDSSHNSSQESLGMYDVEEEDVAELLKPKSAGTTTKSGVRSKSKPKKKVRILEPAKQARKPQTRRVATRKPLQQAKKPSKSTKPNRKPVIVGCLIFGAVAVAAFVLWLLHDQGIISWWKHKKSRFPSDSGGGGESQQPVISVPVEDAISAEFGSKTVEFLANASSPQSKAAKWIDEVDSTFTFPLAANNPSEAREFRQRYALATFYYSTLGPDFWYENLNFLSSSHECDWNQGALGVKCNSNLDVSEINLVLNGLRGTIPPEIGRLGTLNVMELDGNRIGGSLPDEIYQLTNLSTLSIPFSQLTGTLSSMIGNLAALENLWLEGAVLNGSLPSELNRLSNLQSLKMRDNSISGTLPDFGSSSSLQMLDLEDNSLIGTVPLSYASLPLVTFDIGRNFLKGDISFICRISSLDQISADCPLAVTCPCCPGCSSQTRQSNIFARSNE